MTICGPCLVEDHATCFGKRPMTRWTGRCECIACLISPAVEDFIENTEEQLKLEEERTCRREQRQRSRAERLR